MNVEDQLIKIIADVLELDTEDLSPEMGPETLEEWDSVNALRILTSVETDLGVRLTMKNFMDAKNIRQLANAIGSA